MSYSEQFEKLRQMLSRTGNPNLIRDFLIQLHEVRRLDMNLIQSALDHSKLVLPEWLPLVNKTDIRNVVVFLIWKEFQTVIDAKESLYHEESKLGTNIEHLSTYLETMYYIDQVEHIDTIVPISYQEWVHNMVNRNGLEYAIDSIYNICTQY